ncbi:hypothetical protein [Shewanella baltica]|uniref:hypothetical protein n=1 Tax=Shewanella baltica TaxID=62322 RepID=UPI00217E63E8|nr:hypothetical protein [Shewanella baltica]MCS6101293.1 hypothetical protein [Shewanella baltica]MCS6184262.1 hypothetical protein [Shewanella baltica]
MPTTWIEIADTTVKIGLGAIISGASAYMLARHNHSKSIEKEYLLKHREVMELVTLDIEEMTHVLLKYWSFILDWERNKEKGIKNSEEKSEQITNLRSEVFSLFKGLSSAEGRLLLLGCKEQQSSLRAYGEKISEFYRYASRNNDEMDCAILEEWRIKLLSEREGLYSSLSKAYKKAKI